MITRSEFEIECRKAGFTGVWFVPPKVIESGYTGLVSDPFSILPGARTLIILAMPYSGLNTGDKESEAVISAYYLASHRAYRASKKLAAELGDDSVSNVQLPVKRILFEYGIGEYGFNSLISIVGMGSCFHIQLILTRLEFAFSHLAPRNEFGFSTRCRNCGLCVEACPTKAILPGGKISENRCLRSVSELTTVPTEYEQLLGNRLLGCDICQAVCPRNNAAMDNIAYTYSLKKLLTGDIDELRDKIGPNYARKTRLAKKACVIAANLRRTDLLPEIEALCVSTDSSTVQAAERTLERMSTECE